MLLLYSFRAARPSWLKVRKPECSHGELLSGMLAATGRPFAATCSETVQLCRAPVDSQQHMCLRLPNVRSPHRERAAQEHPRQAAWANGVSWDVVVKPVPADALRWKAIAQEPSLSHRTKCELQVRKTCRQCACA